MKLPLNQRRLETLAPLKGELVTSSGLEERAACSPSPQPSPSGKGSCQASHTTFPGVPASRRRWRPFSLSPGERAGVRGNATSERLRLPKHRNSPAITLALAVALLG